MIIRVVNYNYELWIMNYELNLGKFTKKYSYINKKSLETFEFQGLCYFVQASNYFLLRLALFW